MDLARDFYVDPAQRRRCSSASRRDGSVVDYRGRRAPARRQRRSAARSPATSTATPTGAVRGVEGVLRDITERKRAERALADAEERSRLLLAVGRRRHLRRRPPGSRDVHERRRRGDARLDGGGTAGISMHDAIHYARADGSPYPIDECPQHAAYTEGLQASVDDEVLWRKDGTCFPVEYMARPLLKDGEVTGAIITFRDISERRAAEAALARAASASTSCCASSEVGVWEWEIAADVAALGRDDRRALRPAARRAARARGRRSTSTSIRTTSTSSRRAPRDCRRDRRPLRGRVPRDARQDGTTSPTSPSGAGCAATKRAAPVTPERCHLGRHRAPHGRWRSPAQAKDMTEAANRELEAATARRATSSPLEAEAANRPRASSSPT